MTKKEKTKLIRTSTLPITRKLSLPFETPENYLKTCNHHRCSLKFHVRDVTANKFSIPDVHERARLCCRRHVRPGERRQGDPLGQHRGGDDEGEGQVPPGLFPRVQVVAEGIPADALEHTRHGIRSHKHSPVPRCQQFHRHGDGELRTREPTRGMRSARAGYTAALLAVLYFRYIYILYKISQVLEIWPNLAT